MYPTVRQVLALPVVRQGGPRVVAGDAGLDNPVRWVHVAEVSDIAHLLKGAELVLTTGIALPDDDRKLSGYIDGLAEVGIAGLVIELVQHWSEALPAALVNAAQRHGIPLITLSRETRYVAISEAVNGLIVDAQVAELRAAEQVHTTFTDLTTSGAEPAAVLREVARITGEPAVLETLAHEVLAYDAAGVDPVDLLESWQRRSRTARLGERTGYHPGTGWLITVVGARGHDWGRLVLICGQQPPHRHLVVIERAASALAVHHLLAREGESLERQAHRAVLAELLNSPVPSADVLARAEGLAVALTGGNLIGMAIKPVLTMGARRAAASIEPALHELAEAIALATRRARLAALVAKVDDTTVRVLLSLSATADAEAVLHRLADALHSAPNAMPVLIGVGTDVSTAAEAGRSLSEAAHVVTAAAREVDLARGTRPAFHRLGDVRLRGLLQLLGDDDRVRAFASRELGELLARDAAQGSRLVQALRHFCANGGNKSAAAAAAHTSRTAYYQQLARIEQVLRVPLEAPESMLSLHVALLIHDLHSNQD